MTTVTIARMTRDDDEELEALQRLSEQIQEAKETNQKLKQTLLAHRSKKLKSSDTDGAAVGLLQWC